MTLPKTAERGDWVRPLCTKTYYGSRIHSQAKLRDNMVDVYLSEMTVLLTNTVFLQLINNMTPDTSESIPIIGTVYF